MLPYILILPALLLKLLIHIIPMGFGVGMSFLGLTQFTIRNWTQAPFVGLRNFRLGLDPSGPIGGALLHSILITSIFTVLVIGGAYLLGLAAALTVNGEFRGRNWFRTLFLIPYALPAFVAIIAWRFMLQQNNGVINTLLVDNLHLLSTKPFWLIGDNAFWGMTMTALWKTWPFAFLFLLAGLQSVPAELYEAASIDGASRLRQFSAITLPLLRPVSFVLILILFLRTFNDFNTPFILFGPAPPASADLLSLHIYVNSFVNWNFGLGAAMSTLLLILLLIVSFIYVRALGVGSEDTHA